MSGFARQKSFYNSATKTMEKDYANSDPIEGDVKKGSKLFKAKCAQCHTSSGTGSVENKTGKNWIYGANVIWNYTTGGRSDEHKDDNEFGLNLKGQNAKACLQKWSFKKSDSTRFFKKKSGVKEEKVDTTREDIIAYMKRMTNVGSDSDGGSTSANSSTFERVPIDNK